MSVLDELAKAYGSRRYARDILECKGLVTTDPWWPMPEDLRVKRTRQSVEAFRKQIWEDPVFYRTVR